MTRLFASLLAALLMTATLAGPADAAAPGTIQTINVNAAAGTWPSCNFTVSVTYTKIHASTWQVFASLNQYTTDGGRGNARADLTRLSTNTAVNITTSGLANATQYYVVVEIQKPWRSEMKVINAQRTGTWTQGTSCLSGPLLAQYP